MKNNGWIHLFYIKNDVIDNQLDSNGQNDVRHNWWHHTHTQTTLSEFNVEANDDVTNAHQLTCVYFVENIMTNHCDKNRRRLRDNNNCVQALNSRHFHNISLLPQIAYHWNRGSCSVRCWSCVLFANEKQQTTATMWAKHVYFTLQSTFSTWEKAPQSGMWSTWSRNVFLKHRLQFSYTEPCQ